MRGSCAKLTDDSPREPQRQAGQSQKRGKENTEKATTSCAGVTLSQRPEQSPLISSSRRVSGTRPPVRSSAVSRFKLQLAKILVVLGGGEKVRITGTNCLLTTNPQRLLPWRRLFWGVGQSVGGRFPQRQTRREIEKSLFAGVSIGFCPRTGVGLVLFSGTQSINELPLLRAIAFRELV